MTQENPVAVPAISQYRERRFGALGNRVFRVFWLSMFISFLGNQMQIVAQGWLVLELTNSPFFLGIVGAVSGLPILLFSLFGGVVADRLERRRLIITCQLSTSCLMLVIALLVLSGRVEIWQVMGIAMGLGLIMAFNDPARQAFVTELVEEKDLLNAISLNAAAMNITRLSGPMVAGAIIAVVGIGFSYLANTALSLVAAATMVSIPRSRVYAGTKKTTVWSNLKEGLSYVRGNKAILYLLLTASPSFMFGAMGITLIPVFARNVLDVGAAGLGQLLAASGLGALAGSIAIASLGNLRRKGAVVLISGMMFNVANEIFAFSLWFPLSLAALALQGFASAFWISSATALFQTQTPAALRGRVMSIYLISIQTILLSQVMGGTLATFIGAPHTVALGGALGFLGYFTAFVVTPVIRRLD